VTLPVFKTGDWHLDVNGAFDSHTLPPVLNGLRRFEITGNQLLDEMASRTTLECAFAISSVTTSP
jgi:hypothetical protein